MGDRDIAVGYETFKEGEPLRADTVAREAVRGGADLAVVKVSGGGIELEQRVTRVSGETLYMFAFRLSWWSRLLRRELVRWLAGLPVSARPGSADRVDPTR